MFKNLLKKRQKGFTIIEVMIVLAIAGLIMVVVLIAIPQLQRSQRDSNRQNVVNRINSELGAYSSNNNGTYPFVTLALADFNSRYVANLERRNPQTGNNYAVVAATAIADQPTADQIMIFPGTSCTGELPTGTISTTSRQYSLVVLLERANVFYCIDNN